ncbi:hypothetical protein PR001_g4270 [Phytophthora rubi]|uniref:DUF4219 domain-containing protein n=1 Tax=Phytophthora rubi TaxID=129364 RepID=A0A6A3P3X5_9STRA|nr:hypothetical protein PR001_g4270 [Phytophthora rubi]
MKEEKCIREPFDGDSFEVWMERVSLKLRRNDLWGYCEKDVVKLNELEKSKKGTKKDELKKITRANEILFDCMTDKIMKTVKPERTPFSILEMLKEWFVGKTYFK